MSSPTDPMAVTIMVTLHRVPARSVPQELAEEVGEAVSLAINTGAGCGDILDLATGIYVGRVRVSE